ncbi:MAG: inositol monophosphatase family protein [Planctomycetota bacterium]|nr:inositol monophosphatase family protein [Planctomycetota bacterium]
MARSAAEEAGRLLLEHFGRLGGLGRGVIATKSARRDLVTAADVASERLLVRRLRAAFPDHAIESEEEVRDPAGSGPRWFLDPLDGTVNFVHSLPCFAVSMALFVEGEPEVAVVHAPLLGETFTAERGSGASPRNAPLRVSSTDELADAVLATGFPYRRHELEHDNLANFAAFFHEVRGLRRMGSAAIDLAYTAAGRFDGFWELHLAPHDVAAGALLVREAGGVVTDADGGEDWLRGGHIVAAGEAVHRLLVGRIQH